MPALPGSLLFIVSLVAIAAIVAVFNARSAARSSAMQRRLDAERAKAVLIARYETQVAMVDEAPPSPPFALDEGEVLVFTGASERVIERREPGSLTISSRRVVFVGRESMLSIPRESIDRIELSGEQYPVDSPRGVRYAARAMVRFRRQGEPANERFDVDDDVYLVLALHRSGLPQTGDLALPARPA